MPHFDFLVLGSGIAGISFALEAAAGGTVAVVTKKESSESNTNYAQGGIASVLGSDDSFESHVADTLTAGDGLCHEDVVRFVVEHGPEAIERLKSWGASFSLDATKHFDLGREGGHSHRRIVHSKDSTGREVERALLDSARNTPSIAFFENHFAIDLLVRPTKDGETVCFGAYVLNPDGLVETFTAPVVCLATGGSGKVYLYTSNPDIASGDGVAMAYRAGATLANLEFMQFHPTCLYHPYAKNFLISEAVRGEGGRLRLPGDGYFMDRYHKLAELAPRDVVARAIDNELKRTGLDYVELDISHLDPAFVTDRFPGIYAKCLEFGIDITRGPIPIVPAAHYMCGGVLTDRSGRTTIQGLYALGEVACTGLHGANRLASNSLLEAVVFSQTAAADALARHKDMKATIATLYADPWNEEGVTDSDEYVVINQNWDEIRRFMWNYVGIVRSNKRLQRAKTRIALLGEEINDYYRNFRVTPPLLELRNLAVTAELMIRCALARKESRGLHYNIDHPSRDDKAWAKDTMVRKMVA